MDFGAMLQSIIYIISSTMLYPAMLVLLISFVIIIVSVGSFLAEWAARSRRARPVTPVQDILTGKAVYTGYLKGILNELETILHSGNASWEQVEALWRQTKFRQWKKLDYLRVLVRLGPSLGLMCTLIPMTTGLAALSQGDMSRLSSDLVIAFSTTVVGLAIGVIAYILYTFRARWLEHDLETLQIIIESKAAALYSEEGQR